MKASVDSLLEPISAENPCGEDLAYDPKFLELDTLLQGKPETQFAAAEEPDWKAVTERCEELSVRSKDLRVAVRMALAWMKMAGLPGFRDGLLVIKGLIEKYWEPVFPRLDPDDGNDPLERVNILSSLSTPVGTFGDPLKFLARLRQVPLSDSALIGRISLAQISGVAAPSAEPISAAQAQGAFRSTPPEKLQATYEAVTGAQAAVREIDELLTKAVGSSRAVSFDSLASLLEELRKTLAPFASPNEEAPTEAAAGGESAIADGGGHQTAGPGISGTVRSRQDVIRVIEQICDFYKRTEPSSPVPLILQRARRLAEMDFLQLLTDLAPDSLGQINMIAGIRPEPPTE